VRVSFSLAKELDNGLSAGGSFRADNAVDAKNGTGGSIHLSGPFGKLSMGDVDAGAKAAVGHVSGVGYVNQDDPSDISYLRGGSGDEPALQYMLPKMGPVQVWASVGMATTPVMENGKKVPAGFDTKTNYPTPDQLDADGKFTGNPSVTFTQKYKMKKEISADTLSIGAKADLSIADMGTAWIGGGYEATTKDGDDGHLVLGAGVSASGFSGKVVAGMQGRAPGKDDEGNSVDMDAEQFGVSAGYSAGQIGVTVFYTDDSDFKGANGHEAFGAGFSWSLGGDAHLKGGITNWPMDDGKKDQQTADLGVTFSF